MKFIINTPIKKVINFVNGRDRTPSKGYGTTIAGVTDPDLGTQNVNVYDGGYLFDASTDMDSAMFFLTEANTTISHSYNSSVGDTMYNYFYLSVQLKETINIDKIKLYFNGYDRILSEGVNVWISSDGFVPNVLKICLVRSVNSRYKLFFIRNILVY